MEIYKTIKNEAQDEFVERRSKFISYIKPVQEEQEAIDFINEKKRIHWDATHNVYAYILQNGQIKRYSDDGEPQGTAGIPVLDVLQKAGIVDAVVVVTRYFGGIKLGAGGLVRAYSSSASLALKENIIVPIVEFTTIQLSFDYSYLDIIENRLKEYEIINRSFTNNVTIDVKIPNNLIQQVISLLINLTNNLIQIKILSDNND